MGSDAGRAWRRLTTLLRWRRHDRDMAEEIALHEEMRRDDFIACGMSATDAAFAARRAMGNVTTMQETSREVWRFGWLRDAIQDVAYGARTLRRDPTFALVAILGLAFGLGFAAAVFTGFNAFVLRGWELPEPGRMVALWATTPGRGADGANPSGFSPAQMRSFVEEARTLDGVSAHLKTRADGTGAVSAAPVSAGYFALLGVPMAMGRAFASDEDRLGAPARVVVVSHRYWNSRLSANRNVVGTTVKVSGVPFTVIGVAGEGFDGTNAIGVDAWIPLAAMPVIHPRDRRSLGPLVNADECCIDVIARLAPGASRSAAAAELSAILARHARPGVDTVPRTVTLLPFTLSGVSGPSATGELSAVFSLIGGGVAVVLLLACANVANLLLARATARQREMGIRLALGASRGRIVRQLMTESLLLALLASIPALLIARWAPGFIVRTLTEQALTLQFSADRNVLLLTAGTATLCCLLFGLAPALHASRPLSMQRTRLPLRSVFLSAQVTFCVVLLVAIMARDPSLTVSIRPYSWYVRDATTSATFAALVSGALGALALALASIGMFGVLSYWVQQRQQDISVRMALGAAPMHVVRLVLGTTGCAVGWGLGVGLVLAVGAAQLLRSNLFGLSPMDPASYAGAMGVLALAAIVATLLPVRRAVRIEPMQALRGD